jgi:hypothetical protein
MDFEKLDIPKLLNQMSPDMARKAKKIIEIVLHYAGDLKNAPEAERQFFAKLSYKLAVEILIIAHVKNRMKIKMQLRLLLCKLFDVWEF